MLDAADGFLRHKRHGPLERAEGNECPDKNDHKERRRNHERGQPRVHDRGQAQDGRHDEGDDKQRKKDQCNANKSAGNAQLLAFAFEFKLGEADFVVELPRREPGCKFQGVRQRRNARALANPAAVTSTHRFRLTASILLLPGSGTETNTTAHAHLSTKLPFSFSLNFRDGPAARPCHR
ncbi:hypothetical protein AHiyo8_14880 [Arthrobacter sp. Hiyo8]|nr:hypothetical protein AHiyo8_14880 [Arthrobacter sp. Hiyo8]